jgi:addiction module HigA family antidote
MRVRLHPAARAATAQRAIGARRISTHGSMLNPPHPGLSIRHDCLEPLGLNVTDAAKALGVTRQALNNLVNGKSGISPEMAIRLDKAFGGGAETWLRLQMAYDLARAQKGAAKITVQRLRRKANEQGAGRLL